MQNDETIWTVIGKGPCSFRVKTQKELFCRNQFNVTGICSKVTCPLANGYYATVLEDRGICYLHLKTVERAHLPRDLWEKVPLSRNLTTAMEQIDANMKNIYKGHQIHRCKQRLIKLRQTLLRIRRMQLNPQPILMSESKKLLRREANREARAEKAALLETTIEKTLLQRLKQGIYGNLYNFPTEETEESKRALEEKEITDEENELLEFANGNEIEFVEGESDSEVEWDIEDLDVEQQPEEEVQSSRQRRGRPVLEYEYEGEAPRKKLESATNR